MENKIDTISYLLVNLFILVIFFSHKFFFWYWYISFILIRICPIYLSSLNFQPFNVIFHEVYLLKIDEMIFV